MEICIDSLESARNAINGGASRLEVCSALSDGGLTPTPGLVKLILKNSSIPIYAMIRIRAGNFVYTREEMDAMLFDLKILKDMNVNGFVFGALTSEGKIDELYCKEIITAAHPKPVTFHRAFDEVFEPLKSLEIIISLGFERILTSGQKNSAEEGLNLIRQLVISADGKIVIMPGAGITKDNIMLIKNGSGAKEFHASARIRKVGEGGTKVKMGSEVNSQCVMVADEELIREMVNIVRYS